MVDILLEETIKDVKKGETETEEIEVAEMTETKADIVITNLTIHISKKVLVVKQVNLKMKKVIVGMVSSGCNVPAVLLIR